MKRFLPLVAAAAVLLWLPTGAQAFTVNLVSLDPGFTTEASVNGGQNPINNITTLTPGAGEFMRVQSVVTDSFTNPLNQLKSTASSSWYISATQPQVAYGAFGKDTYFSLIINASMLLDLQASTFGHAGYSAAPNLGFTAVQEDLAHAPLIAMNVSWGGPIGDLASLNASYKLWAFGFPPLVADMGTAFAPNATSDGTNNAALFASNLNKTWLLSDYLVDTLDGVGGLAGANFSKSGSVTLTLHLIEPYLTSGSDDDDNQVPVPPGLVLLGTGLVSLALARRRLWG